MPDKLEELEAEVRRAEAWIQDCEDQYVAAFQRYKVARRALTSAKVSALETKVAA